MRPPSPTNGPTQWKRPSGPRGRRCRGERVRSCTPPKRRIPPGPWWRPWRLFDALVLTGGDTAVGVARRLGTVGIRLEGEVESGVPVGTLIGPSPYRVVTKAGSFGESGTLVKVVETLTQGEKD